MALLSTTELITRYYTNEKLAQRCFNVRPTSVTFADIKPTFGECALLAGKDLIVIVYIQIVHKIGIFIYI